MMQRHRKDKQDPLPTTTASTSATAYGVATSGGSSDIHAHAREPENQLSPYGFVVAIESDGAVYSAEQLHKAAQQWEAELKKIVQHRRQTSSSDMRPEEGVLRNAVREAYSGMLLLHLSKARDKVNYCSERNMCLWSILCCLEYRFKAMDDMA